METATMYEVEEDDGIDRAKLARVMAEKTEQARRMRVNLESPEPTDLSVADRAQLGRYEAVIKRGLQTFVEVGNALAAIRDGNLYRGTHGTFEDYCRERWGIQRAHAYRLIEGAAVVANLSPIGDILPATESQARPLSRLEPEQQREAWAKAVEVAPNGKPTAADVQKAAATFAEPKPAKPAPIAYAKVHQLEACVKAWLRFETVEDGTPSSDSVLDMLKIQSGEPHKSGNWLSLLCQSLIEAEIVWRKADLTQAINNVRDQRRQAKLQASAKVTYLEPRVVVEVEEPATEPDPDELEAVAIVAAEQVEEDAERAARDATRPSFENVPEPIVEPKPQPQGILTREWVIFVLSNYTPASSDFAVALKAATLDDLREAMSSLSTEEKHHVARQKALVARFDELMAPPDPRIAEAQELIALLVAAREGVRRDYGRLCGKHLDTLTFERDVETMCGRLQSLVDILTGKDVTK